MVSEPQNKNLQSPKKSIIPEIRINKPQKIDDLIMDTERSDEKNETKRSTVISVTK